MVAECVLPERFMKSAAIVLQDGIESDRIETIGMGEKEPLFSNDTEENKRRNRRTEVRVLSP